MILFLNIINKQMKYLNYSLFSISLLLSSEKSLYMGIMRILSENSTDLNYVKNNAINDTTNYENSTIINEPTNEKEEVNSTEKIKEIIPKKKKNSKNGGAYILLAFFVVFITMSLYMIYKMKKYEETRERRDDIWRFIFFINNGGLIASVINILLVVDNVLNFIPFIVYCFFFTLGVIYFIIKFVKKCHGGYAEKFFNKPFLIKVFKLPGFIFSLFDLTDPCFGNNSYDVTSFSDDNKESTSYCTQILNCIIYFLKRLALILAIISFYLFALFFVLFWLLGKSIYSIFCKDKNKINNNENPSEVIDSNSNATHDINNISEINSNNVKKVENEIKSNIVCNDINNKITQNQNKMIYNNINLNKKIINENINPLDANINELNNNNNNNFNGKKGNNGIIVSKSSAEN